MKLLHVTVFISNISVMFKSVVRKALPLAALGTGFFMFPHNWKANNSHDRKINDINPGILEKIKETNEYKSLKQNENVTEYYASHKIPKQHKFNYVGSGLLFGPDLFEIDPLILLNEPDGSLTSFYHLGDKMVSHDGLIHNGVIATILDEGLCACGFSKLPSKRGVTARLNINFCNQPPPGCTVVLRANVESFKGRKVVIGGQLETFPLSSNESSTVIAKAECILVEPKWFKYFSWFELW